jgi:outer membrane protein TolC
MEVLVGRYVSTVVTLAFGLAFGPQVALAQQPAEMRAAELTRQALLQAPQASGPVVDLTLDDAVARALESNLDIAVERLSPRMYDYTMASLLSQYRPTMSSSFTNGTRVSLPNTQLTGVRDKLETDTTSWNTGLSQAMPWAGGSFTVNFNNSRTDSSNDFATRNPSYSSNLQASYTQPLLRNFRTDSTRTSIKTTEISQDVSELALEGTIATTVAEVRSAYWDLLYAIRAVDVAEQSLALATKLVNDNRQRVEIGTLAPIDVVAAQAEEATRRQTLVQAQATRQTAELVLKRLTVSGTNDDLWTATINPIDLPTIVEEPVDIQAAVSNALRNRVDLRQAHKQLEANDFAIVNLKNQTLPALDLTANYSLSGLGGTEYLRSGLGGEIVTSIPGGYSQALQNITHFDAPTWNVQLNLSVPLGTSAADANLARARLQEQQTQAQIKALELQVATEVTNIVLTMRSNRERVEAATAARELAQQSLDAAQSRFEVGLATNYEVVQAQRDLADAQNTALGAVLDYMKSLVDLERAQFTGSAGSVTAISGGGG